MALPRPITRALDVSPAMVGVALVSAAVVMPCAWVLVQIVRGVASEGLRGGASPGSAGLLVASLATAGVIAVLATVIAWPAAWAMRACPRFWTPLIALPLLLPPYLAYAGWGLARSPGTPLGDWLARGPAQGSNWWLPVAGKVLAIGGLALWAWPGAALVLAAGVRQVDQGALDAARLEPASALRALALRIAMVRAYILTAFALVTLVMLGSAVPLHVAQLETAAIRVWRLLDQTPPRQHWRVWVGAWPLMALALAGTWLVTGRLLRVADAGGVRDAARPGRPSAGPLVLALAALAASALVPLALFILFMRDWGSIASFVRVESDAIAGSAAVAAAVGALGAGLGVAAFWCGAGEAAAQRAGAAMLRLLALACIVPGILVGHATLAAWLGWAPAVADTPVPLVLAHLARFGIVGAWIGWAAARAEPAERRDLRRLDGSGLRVWARASLADQWRLLAGAGIACGILSLHEIESAVVAAPPGARLLARDMLGFLHFFRQEELCAGAILLVGAGLAAGAAAAVLAGLGRKKSEGANRNGLSPSTV